MKHRSSQTTAGLTMDRRTLLYAFGIASVSSMLSGHTAVGGVVSGKVAVAMPGESRFAFSTAQQARLSPCKLTSEDAAGALSVLELSALPQSGPYLPVHHREDEWYYVLSGEFLERNGRHEETRTPDLYRVKSRSTVIDRHSTALAATFGFVKNAQELLLDPNLDPGSHTRPQSKSSEPDWLQSTRAGTEG